MESELSIIQYSILREILYKISDVIYYVLYKGKPQYDVKHHRLH